MIEYSPSKVFPADLSFDDIKKALEDIRTKEIKQFKLSGKKSPFEKRAIISNERKHDIDVSSTLAYFAICLCSRSGIKSKQFIQEVLIIVNLLYHTILKKGKHFVLRRGTEEKIDMEDNAKASKPISPAIVLTNLFITDLFPTYLSQLNW